MLQNQVLLFRRLKLRMPLTSWSPSTRPRRRRRRWCRTRSRRRRGHVARLESRQQIIAHRELVNRPGPFHRVLLHIVFENAFVGIKVRVPGFGAVLDWILAHADARQSRLIERSVIGSAQVAAARRDRAADAIVFEWLEDVG